MFRPIVSNLLGSSFARLPDPILVNIMEFSDFETLSKLLHTSRIFMILFSIRPEFKHLHLTSHDDPRIGDTARLWEVPRTVVPTQQEAIFLTGRRVCGPCLTRRQGDCLGRSLLSAMPGLYCSGCGATHREMHFSKRMRGAADNDRLCIGREKFLRFCEHTTMTLQQAKVDASSGAGPIRCKYYHNDSRPSCDATTCPADNRPQMQAYRDENGMLRVKISFTCHVQFQRLGNGKICPASLRREFHRYSNQLDVGLWNRVFSRTVHSEMRAFDTNVCDCVDYCQYNIPLPRQRPIRVCPASTVGRWQEAAPEGGCISETGRCAHMRHGLTFGGVGTQMLVDFLRCHDVGKNMLAMRRTVDCAIDLEAASSTGWADLLSWGCRTTTNVIRSTVDYCTVLGTIARSCRCCLSMCICARWKQEESSEKLWRTRRHKCKDKTTGWGRMQTCTKTKPTRNESSATCTRRRSDGTAIPRFCILRQKRLRLVNMSWARYLFSFSETGFFDPALSFRSLFRSCPPRTVIRGSFASQLVSAADGDRRWQGSGKVEIGWSRHEDYIYITNRNNKKYKNNKEYNNTKKYKKYKKYKKNKKYKNNKKYRNNKK